MSPDIDRYNDKAEKQLEHVEGHVLAMEENIPHAIDLISRNSGAPIDSMRRLSSHAQGKAIVSWFKENNLISTKQWFSTAFLLKIKFYAETLDTSGPLGKKFLFLEALASDNKELIEYLAKAEYLFNQKNINEHKKLDYLAYNFMLGLRGEWARLADRCETVLKAPSSSLKKHILDFEFYLALAKGDESRMTGVLLELTKPKVINARLNDESGFTNNLISTYAVIYAKTAWYHGYQITPDTPYIPSAWLPIEPLPVYQKQYSFLGKAV